MKIKPLVVYIFVRLLSLTYRYKYLNSEVLKSINKDQYIFSIWHQNLIGAIFSQINKPHAVIVSPSNDGELVASTCERMGHFVARGSSSRGGQSALKKMIRLLKSYPGAITIDGPQGPAGIPKKGILELAYLTKLPIVPFTIIPKKYWVIEKSWDKFRIPKPFTTFYIHFGAPLHVDKECKSDDFHQASIDLKQQMEQSEAYINSILDAV